MKKYIVRYEDNKFTIEGEIVRCKYCKWKVQHLGMNKDAQAFYMEVDADDYCSYGEKKVTGKLESVEKATSEEKESTMGQPKSKLYIPLNKYTVDRVNRLLKNECGEYFDEEWLYNELEQIAERHQLSPETPTNKVDTPTNTPTDLISRQAATSIPILPKEARKKFKDYDDAFETGWIEALACVNMLPPANTDFSDYCDRLWKIAYERGKTERPKTTETMMVDGEPTEIDPLSYEVGYTHGQSERPKGKWLKVPHRETVYACDQCGCEPYYFGDINTIKFCPNGGSRMCREDGEEE